MSWRKGFRCLAKQYKCRSSESSVTNEHWNGIFVFENSSFVHSQSQRRYLSSLFNQSGNLFKELTFEGNMPGRVRLPGFVSGIARGAGPGAVVVSRQYGKKSGDGPDLSREFFVQLWLADKRKQRSERKQKRKLRNILDQRGTGFDTSFQAPSGKWFSGASIPEETSHSKVKPILKQPPTSQSVTGILEPSSLEEVELSNPSTVHTKRNFRFLCSTYMPPNMKLNFQVITLIGILAAKWPIACVFVASFNLNMYAVKCVL